MDKENNLNSTQIKLRMNFFRIKPRILTFGIVLFTGIFIFLFGLGDTGLVDETPPLFASAGRAMSESGDWLTPKVNGILRFDKPPLFYWLMAFFYSLPGNEAWDELGSLSARLPSALSALFLMILISDTLFCSNKSDEKVYLALVGAFSFALSPLIIIWSRTAVSDSLLCGTLGISLLMFWRRLVSDKKQLCIYPWVILGLANLTKGPVAFVITFLTLSSFLLTQKNWKILFDKINPILGIGITLLVSAPWYLLELKKEGVEFLNSFFGYHNLQRYTSVVNNHSEPWWFFFLIMLIASLPFSASLLHGIIATFKKLLLQFKEDMDISDSLYIFALCWMLSILLFFSISATKLPSYWLPATPAAAILVSRSASLLSLKIRQNSVIWIFTFFILFGLAMAFSFSSIWLDLIKDPEMPNLAFDIKTSGLLIKIRIIFSLMILLMFCLLISKNSWSILYLQITFLLGQFLFMPNIRNLADISRQLPIREISNKIINNRINKEPLVMVGIRKPSLHFYSRQIVFYESNAPAGLINIKERFETDKRSSSVDQPNYDSETFLVVIDKYSKEKDHWKTLKYSELGSYGIYDLLRVKKTDLEKYVKYLSKNGIISNWREYKSEKF